MFIVLGFWLWRELGQDAEAAQKVAAEAVRTFASPAPGKAGGGID
jgi:hypothetical protein